MRTSKFCLSILMTGTMHLSNPANGPMITKVSPGTLSMTGTLLTPLLLKRDSKETSHTLLRMPLGPLDSLSELLRTQGVTPWTTTSQGPGKLGTSSISSEIFTSLFTEQLTSVMSSLREIEEVTIGRLSTTVRSTSYTKCGIHASTNTGQSGLP